MYIFNNKHAENATNVSTDNTLYLNKQTVMRFSKVHAATHNQKIAFYIHIKK